MGDGVDLSAQFLLCVGITRLKRESVLSQGLDSLHKVALSKWVICITARSVHEWSSRDD